jgi:DNA primase
MIATETIDRVREEADIVSVIGEHVKLKRSGGDYRGPCPFHGGKNPNFSVSPKRNAYHCFKCGVSGDAIGFVRDHLGMDFVEAVRYVAERSGIAVVETRNVRDERERDQREPLWEANAAAMELWRTTLWEDAEARAAREYLAGRGLSREDADRFQLGYAPRDGARTIERLNAQGHDEARLLEAGLLRRREEQDAPYAYFRGRLMIPIQDAGGHVVGFGGRVIGDGEPKYLNSPETSLFSKGRMLYGLTWAKHPIRKAERVLVVEGYFDAIRLALAGVEETVAPLGTALTEDQARLLTRLTPNVFLLYDSDEAGLKATFRTGLELLRLGASARVVTLPEGEDPDTYVRTHGAQGLERALAQAVDLFDRQIQLLERKGWFAELHRKRRAIDKLLPTLRATSDPVTRALYVSRLAEVAGMDREVIAREAEQPERVGRRPAPPREGAPAGEAPGGPPPGWDRQAPPPPDAEPAGAGRAPLGSGEGVVFVEPRRSWDDGAQFRMRMNAERRRFQKGRRTEDWASSPAIPRVVTRSARVLRAERDIVRAMLQERDLVEGVAERWDPGSFHHLQYRRIFETLLAEPEAPPDVLANALEADAVQVMDELLAVPEPDPRGTAEAWLRRLQVWAIDEEVDRIQDRLLGNGPPVRDAEKDELLLRIGALRTERAALSAHFSGVRPLPTRDGPGGGGG